MITKSALAPEAACRLLWAAALFDAVLVYVLLQILGPLIVALITMALPGLGQFTTGLAPEIAVTLDLLASMVCFLILLMLYWFVTEIILGGRTVGRLCLMLELRQVNGKRPTRTQLSKRGARKLLTLGLSGASVTGLDSHDRTNGLVWYSPMTASQLSSTRNWRIKIKSGVYANTSHVLDRLAGYNRDRTIRIGRDPVWADIVLDSEEKVSSQHAKLRLGNKGWRLMDYGGGRPGGSSNKTFVNRQAIPPGRWVAVDPKSRIRVAGVEISLERTA